MFENAPDTTITALHDITQNLVEFRSVSLIQNNKTLIDQVACKITDRGKTMVMGANGAGKSMFIRIMAGLITPTNGTIVKGNHSLSMAFQSPILLRRSTFANIEYVLKNMGISRHDIPQLAAKALKESRLSEKAKNPARSLSGGERQRLALARALVVKPKLLLLDEITASLDPASTYIVESMIENASKNGTKVVMVTHDIRQAKRIGDEVIFIHEGKILSQRPADEFFRGPGSIEAQAYLDGMLPIEIRNACYD